MHYFKMVYRVVLFQDLNFFDICTMFARLDPRERVDPAKFHPDTRIVVIGDIIECVGQHGSAGEISTCGVNQRTMQGKGLALLCLVDHSK